MEKWKKSEFQNTCVKIEHVTKRFGEDLVFKEPGNTGRYEKNDFKGRYPPDPKKSRTGSGYEKAGWKVLSWNAATPWDCTGHYGRSSLPDSG